MKQPNLAVHNEHGTTTDHERRRRSSSQPEERGVESMKPGFEPNRSDTEMIARLTERLFNKRLISRRRNNVSEKGRACDASLRVTAKRQLYMREWERLHKFERLLMARVRRQMRRCQENAI